VTGTRRIACGALLCLALAGVARAEEVACWAPDRSQPPDPAVARAAPIAALDADIAAVSAVLKRNGALRQIPNTRLGITSYIGYPNPGFGNAVRISAGLYPPNTWRDGCTLMEGPEFFNSGHVHVTFNEPRRVFHDVPHRLQDDVLTAFAEPTGAVKVGDETYFASIRGVVLTPERVPAWLPVTNEDLLAYRERQARSRIEGLERQIAQLQSSVETYRADMQQQIAQERDPAIKAQLRKAMEDNTEMLRSGNAEAQQQYDDLLRSARAELEAVGAEREQSSPSQLEAPGRLDGTPLVKLNPALSGRKGRVNLIVVNAFANDQAMWEPLAKAVRAVDYPALRDLLR
jgi:hypothetical protein